MLMRPWVEGVRDAIPWAGVQVFPAVEKAHGALAGAAPPGRTGGALYGATSTTLRLFNRIDRKVTLEY